MVQVTEIDIEAVKLTRDLYNGTFAVALKLGPAGAWLDVIKVPDDFSRTIEVSAAQIEDIAINGTRLLGNHPR